MSVMEKHNPEKVRRECQQGTVCKVNKIIEEGFTGEMAFHKRLSREERDPSRHQEGRGNSVRKDSPVWNHRPV